VKVKVNRSAAAGLTGELTGGACSTGLKADTGRGIGWGGGGRAASVYIKHVNLTPVDFLKLY